MLDLTLRVSGSHFTSTDQEMPRGWHLRVEDDASGVVLTDVQLNPVQLQTILAGGQVKATGSVANTLDRVGKKMRVWDRMVPDHITEGVYDKAVREELARDWSTNAEDNPFDTLEIRHQNNGLKAVYRVWEEV